MISFKQITPKDFNKSHNPKIPKDDEIKSFKKEVSVFLSKAISQKEEEFQKNEINKFLTKIYGYDCNTRGKIDSAIYVEDKAQVLIEVKSTNNKKEFPESKDNPLSKALYESILYFLREHKGEKNNSIKHIILCNPCEFFIFDVKEFKIFFDDKTIKEMYKNCDENKGVDTSTNTFYKDLESYLKTNFDKTLQYTYFRLDSNLSEEALSAIYTLLSPQVLLDQKNIIDANTLNKGFYEELLYILGLQEVSENGKSGGKILITPSTTKNTLSDAIRQAYPKLDDEAIFTLITTWNNRILFLRLLESMLLNFKHIDEPFLNISIIESFKTLQTLFFEVLAKATDKRSSSLPKRLLQIPYLNSSLFDRIPLEREGKEIGLLDSYELPLFSRSILKKDERFKDKDSLPLLDYLFVFLHAYKFTTTSKDIVDEVDTSHDILINSAVLGLVFEKLNGYKEGSFYTPSFITSYMCKESITQAVIEKFNQVYQWEATSLEEVRNYSIRCKLSTQELLCVLLSLRICDPAVGSGHFLVSALNEIIKIAYELGLISSFINNTTLELKNDEILIKTQGVIHQYTKPNDPSLQFHKIQEELFHLKKSIIENCLFGVDINPNSCEITKLRLWIELLKYSYYLFDDKGENTNALETLPNIDINIKCGNSLISYFGLDDSFSHIQNIKEQINQYKHLVKCYKEGIYENKSEIDKKILDLQQIFKNSCLKQKYAKESEVFLEQCQKYSKNYGDYLAKEDLELSRFISAGLFVPDFDENEAKKDFQALKDTYRKIFSLEENKPFEWRFAFPEVLDEEGNFLGFDCVIGNPPYINTRELSKNNPIVKEKYKQIYREVSGLYDIFILFILMGLRLQKVSNFAWIIPNKFTSTEYGKPIFEKLKSENKIKSIIDVSNIRTFESASVYPILLIGQNNSTYSEYYIESQEDLRDNNLRKRTPNIVKSHFITMKQYGLKFQSGTTGFEAQKISSYIKSGHQQDSIPFAVSGSIDKYICDISKVPYMKKHFNYPHISLKAPVAKTKIDFWTNEKIVIAGMTKVIEAYYAKTPLALGVGIYAIYDFCEINPLLILGVLNSSFISWYARENFKDKHMSGGYLGLNKGNLEKLPMFKLTQSNQSTADKIIALVEKILALKESNPKANTQELEQKIDSLVYTLYGLSDDEISIIEGKE